MNDFMLFCFGIVVTLIAGMGVITSQVFMGYAKFVKQPRREAEQRRRDAQREDEKEQAEASSESH